jgi:hypothetical protein
MNMKAHILAALREQLGSWEELLASLSEAQITTPHFDFDWSIKDVMAHLWAWQQISIARMEGGLRDQEPQFPTWIVASIETWEEDADRVNALTFETQHHKPWSEIYQNWENGFLQFLELGQKIAEKDLLDGDRYSWLNGYSLAFILVASYDHHQEHLEKLIEWLVHLGINNG